MNDDFNVREAMAALLELTTAVNKHVDSHETYDYVGLKAAVEAFELFGGEVFGLQFETVSDGTVELASELVELVLDVREEAREAGNYDQADLLRDRLEAMDIAVEDSGDGSTFRFT